MRYVINNEVTAIPGTRDRESLPWECVFVLSFVVREQSVSSVTSLIDSDAIGAPLKHLVTCRVIYHIPCVIVFSGLGTCARRFGHWVFVTSPFGVTVCVDPLFGSFLFQL
jgi:hypothetical protein